MSYCLGDEKMVIKFRRTIRKYGGSLTFTLPAELLKAISLGLGDEVDLYLDNGNIIVEKVKA